MGLFQILKNIIFALSGSFLSIPLSLLGLALVARWLGPSKYGVFSFALEFGFAFSLFAEAGLGVLANREISTHRHQSGLYLGNLFFLKLLLSVFFFLVMLLVALLWGIKGEEFKAVCLMGAANFLLALMSFFFGIFRGFNNMAYEGALTFFQPLFYVLSLVVVFSILGADANLILVSLMFFISYLVVSVLSYYIIIMRFQRPEWIWDSRLIRYFVRESIPLLLGIIVYSLFGRVSFFILKGLSTPEDIGYFSIAFRLTFNLVMIPYVISGAWMSTLAQTFLRDKNIFHDNVIRMLGFLSCSVLILCIALTLFGPYIIELFFGSQYQPAVPVFKIMVWAMFFFSLNFGFKTVFESCGAQRLWAILMAAGLVINVVFNFLLIPAIGLAGASWALLLASLSIFLGSLMWIHKYVATIPDLLKACRRHIQFLRFH